MGMWCEDRESKWHQEKVWLGKKMWKLHEGSENSDIRLCIKKHKASS